MFRISFDLDKGVFDTKTSSVKLSSKENNALMFDENGAIYIPAATMDPGNRRNTPGNGFDGDVDASISQIRLNNTVSRKIQTDPDSDNEGCSVVGFVNGLIHYLMAGSPDQMTLSRYTMTSSKPSDWDQFYATYYTKDNDNQYHYVEPAIDPITGEKIAPTWVANRYYKFEYYNIKLIIQTEQPADWESAYATYYRSYYEGDVKKYTHVDGVPTSDQDPTIIAPTWEDNLYYTGVEVTSS